jgi:hypothetical protein
MIEGRERPGVTCPSTRRRTTIQKRLTPSEIRPQLGYAHMGMRAIHGQRHVRALLAEGAAASPRIRRVANVHTERLRNTVISSETSVLLTGACWEVTR